MFMGHNSRQGRNGEEGQIPFLIDLIFVDDKSELNFG